MSKHRGELILSPAGRMDMVGTAPLRSGSDVSWLPKCKVGDNQGSDGACAIFTLANWAEVMHDVEISDADCLDLYAATIKKLGRMYGGLTFSEAFSACHRAGWFQRKRALARVTNLEPLARQPIVAGYAVTRAWENVSPQGCLDHAAPLQPVRGYHAVLIVAHGNMEGITSGPWVYIENSWGLSWGWNGIGVMSEDLHRHLCGEMWVLQ